MALFEGKTPGERNKMIAAIVLPVIVLILIIRMFSGPSGPSGTAASNNDNRRQRANRNAQNSNSRNPDARTAADDAEIDLANYTPIVCCAPPYGGSDAGRNIFAFYEKPVAPKPAETPLAPATPTPTPPIALASLSPQSVFAKTGNLTLQISGDKFGPADRVFMDGQELPTQYRSVQQLTATVPSALIAGPGQRSVVVRTTDGKLYSNSQMLNVMQPPAPTYTYVGFLKRARANTAVLKDSRGELYSVREGDIVEGRFRVTEISERTVEVVDKDLNIKHTMPYVAAGAGNGPNMERAPGAIRPPPPPADEGGDEEPL